MKLKRFNSFLNESEISEHSNKTGDMTIVMKQLKDYIKPSDNKSGYDAKISKNGNTITVSKNGHYVKIKDNGKPNDFYSVTLKDSSGVKDEGDANSSENVLTFVGNVFDKSSGIDKKNSTTKNGNINNKY